MIAYKILPFIPNYFNLFNIFNLLTESNPLFISNKQ